MDQQVYETLFEAMLSGILKPGERLVEVQLCKQFKVSRTVVRQALRRLAELRVVNIVANKGATVASPSPQEALEVFEARRAIEAAVVRRLAQRIGQSDINRLRQCLRAKDAALHKNYYPRWAQLESGFHIALAKMAGSAELLRLMTELLTRCTLIMALYKTPGNALCNYAEHDELVDLLALHDGEAAAQLMDLHIEALQQRLVFPA